MTEKQIKQIENMNLKFLFYSYVIDLFIKTNDLMIAAAIIKQYFGKNKLENIIMKNNFFKDIVKKLQYSDDVLLLWEKVKILVDGEIILSGYEINSKKKKDVKIRLYDNDNFTNIYFSLNECCLEHKTVRWTPSINDRYRFRKADTKKKRGKKEWDKMLLRI